MWKTKIKMIEDIVNNNAHKDTFKYWFERIDADNFRIYRSDTEVGTVCKSSKTVSPCNYGNDVDDVQIILSDFNRFVEYRPEFYIGYSPEMSDTSTEMYAHMYENKLAGCIFSRYADEEKAIKLLEKCISWLRSTDFYEAPASTRFHDSFPNGLVKHTLEVVNQVEKLSKLDAFKSVDIVDITLLALVHDWCKIGMYEKYMRNVKDEGSGQWVKVPSYRVCDRPLTNLGHGVSSLFIAQRFFNFTYPEACAIRWHMGHWRVSSDEVNELQFCNEHYPMVHMLQFADQLSITQYI